MIEKIKLSADVTVKKENNLIVVAGKLGELRKKLSYPKINVDVADNEVTFSSDVDSRKSKKLINTFIAHLKNMEFGVTKGFVCKMKVLYTHFPTTVKLEGNKFIIENFIGERAPRFAKIFPGVEVKIEKQDITLTGTDIYAVSQSAANIEQATRITGKDRRIFQDGIYVTKKTTIVEE